MRTLSIFFSRIATKKHKEVHSAFQRLEQRFIQVSQKNTSRNVRPMLVMLTFLLVSTFTYSQIWNKTYTNISGGPIAGISGIAEMGSSHYIIQSTDGTVSKIDLAGNVVWSISDCSGACASDNTIIQQSVAVKGNKILAINNKHWRLIQEVSGVPSIVAKRGWQFESDAMQGFPVRVKLLDGDFFVCGGLYKQFVSGFVSPNFIMRINDSGGVVWNKNYDSSNSGTGGSPLPMQLITDVELWTEGRIVATQFQGRPTVLGFDKTSINVISASSGVHLERIDVDLQKTLGDPTIGGADVIGFWDLEIVGNQASMVGYVKGDQINSLFCNYNLLTHTINSLNSWSLTDRTITLTNLVRNGSVYYASGALSNKFLTVVGDAKMMVVKTNASGTSIDMAFEMYNTNLKINYPLDAPTSSALYAKGSNFMIGCQTEYDLVPVVRKATSLNELGCQEALNITIHPWNYEVEPPYPSWHVPIYTLNVGYSQYLNLISDNHGCCASLEITADNTTICEGETTLITASGSGVGLTYTWSSLGGAPFTVISPDQIEIPGILTPGSYIYCVTVTDGNGCTDEECIVVTVLDTPDLSDIDGKIYCLGLSYPLPDFGDDGSWSGTSVIEAGGNYYFSPFVEGTYILTYCSPDGCCATATVLVGGPEVSISGELDLCESSPTTLTALIGVYPHPVDILWSPSGETTPSIVVTTPGTIMVTVTSTVAPYCSTVATVVVIGDGSWHKTTENSDGTETTNDIVTDSQGNVYVTGIYKDETELQGGANPNLLLDPIFGSVHGNMYVAKYNKCGTLIWAARTTESPNCSGNSLVLDEENGVLYVAGDIMQFARFHNSQGAGAPCTSGATIPLAPAGIVSRSSFVAQYDMLTGCLYFAEPVYLGAVPNTRTITANEVSGDIFIGGQYLPSLSHTEQYVFIQKYSPTVGLGTGNVLGTLDWQAFDNVLSAGSSSVVNDLDFDEANNRLYGIGTFKKQLNLFNGTLFNITNVHGEKDAFLISYADAGMSSVLLVGRNGNGNANGYMEGNGISIHNTTGAIFLTGSYSKEVIDPFDLVANGINPLNSWSPSDASSRAYMIGANLVNTMTAWSRQVKATPSSSGYVLGKDVTVRGNDVYFLNEFSSNLITSMAAGADADLSKSFVGNPIGNTHLGLLGFSFIGNRNWMNITTSPSLTSSDDQNGNSITTDAMGHCFVAGEYNNGVAYDFGSPASGNLNHTGVIGGYNAMILRVQNSTGELKSGISTEDNSSEFAHSFEVNLWPNPNKGSFKVEMEISEEITEMYVLDMYGSVILKKTISESTTEVNLTNLASGIYFIKLVRGEATRVERIVIQ